MPEFAVSCIIPTHGRPDFLREALESVLQQSFPVREVIVVSDDGNPESERVVASFSDRAVPVRHVRNMTSPGASGSRNLGAQVAEGEWLAFLDDDDLWAPEMLQHVAEIVAEHDTDCVVTWLELFRGNDAAPGLQIAPRVTARISAAQNPGVTGSNFVMRRVAFDKHHGFDPDLRVLNDIDFFYRFLLNGGSYEVNPRPEVKQRRHNDGQLTRDTEMRAKGVEQYMNKHRSTMRLSDVRHLRLMAHRIRYRAATRLHLKLKHLLCGAFYASPNNFVRSVTTWNQRKVLRSR